MSRRKALITGITSRDRSYLAELLLAKDYEVHGLVRRVALEDPAHRLHGFQDRLTLPAASVESLSNLSRIVGEVMPDECYHLAAQSFGVETGGTLRRLPRAALAG